MTQLPAYDRNEALLRAGNDEQRAKRYLSLLLDSFGDIRETMAAARETGDWQSIRHSVHRMRGAASYCGAIALSAVTQQIGDAIGKGRRSEAEDLLDALGREMERLEALAKDII